MTDERLAELDALCASLPAGDHDCGYPDADGWSDISRGDDVVGRMLVELDAEFYCIARTAVPELVAEVRRLRAELARRDAADATLLTGLAEAIRPPR
jgi:hypothetical protein